MALMNMDTDRRKRVIDETLQNIDIFPDQGLKYWISRLAVEYPADIGILSPMLLNLICLEPGQALYLPAGELHAYLEGLGVELMANSDNVLRGGLTPKHVDLPQLAEVVHFKPRSPNFLKPAVLGASEKVYRSPAEEFILSAICVSGRILYESPTSRSIEILICTEGTAAIEDCGTGTILKISRGKSLVIPAAVERYTIKGTAGFYKAAVPDKV